MNQTLGASPFRYSERPPSPGIAPWVLSLWSFQADQSLTTNERYTVWPDGCTSIALMRLHGTPPSIVAVGPRKSAMQPPLIAGQRLWGVRLWPDAVQAATGVGAPALRDHLGFAPAPLTARFGLMATALPASDDVDEVLAALDVTLATLLRGIAEPDAQIRQAVRAIVAAKGEVAMADVARAAGMGLRHLQRRFPAATGLTLREYARIRRLREALARRIDAHPAGWSRIAAETGFVDHAHLTREFRALTGLAPTDASQQLARTAHANVVP